MKNRAINLAVCVFTFQMILFSGVVHADRGKGDHGGANINLNVHLGFGDRERVIVRDYYGAEYSRGHCPPGLAKKRNGCMPPGQAKQWRKGYPLPRDVIYYDLPPHLIVELGVPPKGYKYVRVAADILMIAVGTAIVVDAIEDLSRL
jgi:Ni/Co efflux regulator RcnB